MAEWRECERRAKSGRSPYVRLCHAIGMRVGPINCARCDRPALVEAVRAAESAWWRASDGLAYTQAADGPSNDTGELHAALGETCEILQPGRPYGLSARGKRPGEKEIK